MPPPAIPLYRILCIQDAVSRIIHWETHLMAIEAQLACHIKQVTLLIPALLNTPLVRHTVLPAVAEYTTERGCRKSL